MKTREKRFLELLARDNTKEKYIERQSLLYLLSGVDSLYHFNNHTIKPECRWTREERNLIGLAFNLYNNFEITPLEAFHGLSKKAFELAVNAIAKRVFA